MRGEFDPIVAAALDQVAPEVEADPDVLLHGAHARMTVVRRYRPEVTRTVVVALAVTAVLVLVFASPWEGGGPSLVDRALAAVGDRPVLHAVLRYSHGTRINLRTGQRSPVVRDAEVWYEAHRHILRSVLSVDGRIVSRMTGEGSLGLDDPAFIATDYRRALKQGKLRKIGKAVVRGHRVIILDASSGGRTWRAALDAKSFQLVRLQFFEAGRLGSQLDVLLMESVTREQARLPRTAAKLSTTAHGSSSVATPANGKVPKVFTRPGLWAGPVVSGHKLSSVLVWQETSQRTGGPVIHADVTHVVYGGTSRLGSTPFLEIEEAPAAQAAPLWNIGGDYAPPAGYVDLRSSYYSSGPGAQRLQWIGLVRKRGFYVRITCWSRPTLLTTARALRAAPVH